MFMINICVLGFDFWGRRRWWQTQHRAQEFDVRQLPFLRRRRAAFGLSLLELNVAELTSQTDYGAHLWDSIGIVRKR